MKYFLFFIIPSISLFAADTSHLKDNRPLVYYYGHTHNIDDTKYLEKVLMSQLTNLRLIAKIYQERQRIDLVPEGYTYTDHAPFIMSDDIEAEIINEFSDIKNVSQLLSLNAMLHLMPGIESWLQVIDKLIEGGSHQEKLQLFNEWKSKLTTDLNELNFATFTLRENYLSFVTKQIIKNDPSAVIYISFGKKHYMKELANSNLFRVVLVNTSNFGKPQPNT